MKSTPDIQILQTKPQIRLLVHKDALSVLREEYVDSDAVAMEPKIYVDDQKDSYYIVHPVWKWFIERLLPAVIHPFYIQVRN